MLTKKPALMLVLVLALSLAGIGHAEETIIQKEETQKILSFFKILGVTTAGSMTDKPESDLSDDPLFPEYMVPINVRDGISSETINAETDLYDNAKQANGSKWKCLDDRQTCRPNYKLILALILTVGYFICTYLVCHKGKSGKHA